MASSSSKPLFSDGYPPVSNEEFNLFHTLDRKLFTRLVFNLGRDPAESTQVMALWMWLEKKGKEIYLVNKLLHTLPDVLLNVMADESVMVLNCIGSDDFPYSSSLEPEIPVIQSTTKTDVTLKFFHEHRLGILRGVTDLFNQVCLRAFQDILHPEYMINTQGGPPSQNVGGHFIYNPMFPFVFPDPSGVVPGFTQYHHPQGVGVPHGVFPQYFPPHQPQPQPQPHVLAAGGSSSSNVGGFFPRATFDPYDLAVQRQIMNNEIGDLFSRMQLKDDTSNVDRETQTAADQEVPIDDRTIFLTFSKGYPISENEINEFFNGRYGDVVEAVYMQEVVAAEDQPLYARLVVPSASVIETVLEGRNRAKFSINGKHVWARKFVRKNHPGVGGSQPSSPSSSSPTS